MSDRSQGDHDAEGIDIPPWLSLLVLFSVSSSLFVALTLNSNPYLTSSSGYADGGDMYSHQVEALYLKELLQNGTTDLWFDEVTLGYPYFLAYHPFPCLFTSSLMILTEPFLSPLLLFRWMFVILLSSMPWSWYAGLRKLGMTRLEATLAALCVHSIHSWRKFGLELDAFREYGIFTQVYGMAIFPLAVGFLYQYVLYGSGSRNGTVVLVILNFTAHTFFGIYLCVVTAVIIMIDLFSNPLPFKRKLSSPSLWRVVYVHVFSVSLLSWWILPLLINTRYVGGLPWKNDSENGYKFEFVIRNLLSGEIFDHGRKLPFITMGFLAGLSCACLTYRKNDETDGHRTERQTLYIWLGSLFSVTVFLFLGRTTMGALYDVIPFHKEIEVVRYINGIHFCGLLLMAVSFARILRFMCATFCRISKASFKSHFILMTVMLVIPPVYLNSQLQQINSLLTLTDTQGSLEGLKEITSYPDNGRLLAQKVLGTGGPWHLTVLPHHSKKPGILTYSRGYHDTLSLYYLELLQPNLDITPWFPDLLRLYNIRFLATSRIENFYQTEHLLLKVTCHPFWKCAFHSSSDATDQARDWHETPVHHVTPNLMTVVLPPGRHHVTCQYKNPIYQKVGFVLFFMIFIALLMKELANLVQSTCYKSLFIVV